MITAGNRRKEEKEVVKGKIREDNKWKCKKIKEREDEINSRGSDKEVTKIDKS